MCKSPTNLHIARLFRDGGQLVRQIAKVDGQVPEKRRHSVVIVPAQRVQLLCQRRHFFGVR